MACRKCLEHRRLIAEAVKAGSVTRTGTETVAALRTLNKKMVTRFGRTAIARVKPKT